ncbi:MAG: winged helix DNA-binding domain-containing protein [Myxococcota bacterium]
MEAHDLRRQRLTAGLLAPPRPSTAEDAVRHCLALQAQDTRAMHLAVRSRADGAARRRTDRALEQRTLVRTWLMRGTLHLVHADDVRWMLDLFGERAIRSSRRRLTQLGLTDGFLEGSVRAMADVFGDEPLTRPYLLSQLEDRGLTLPEAPQAAHHLLRYAALRGAITRGPDDDEDDVPTFLWLDAHDRPGPELPRTEALQHLGQRFLASRGPATADDLAAWSGLSKTDARLALEGSEGTPEVRDSPPRLLGAFDELLLSWADRDAFLPVEHAAKVRKGGVLRAGMLADDRIVGTWRYAGGSVALEPFDDAADLARWVDEVDAVERFLG